MNCGQCGNENPANAAHCVSCGAPFAPPVQLNYADGSSQLPNYLVHAILCTCFCFLPFGIVAIVHAAQVNNQLAAGNLPAARQASRDAWKWCKLAFWTALGAVIAIAGLQCTFLGCMAFGGGV